MLNFGQFESWTNKLTHTQQSHSSIHSCIITASSSVVISHWLLNHDFDSCFMMHGSGLRSELQHWSAEVKKLRCVNLSYVSSVNGASSADLHLVSFNMPCPIAVRAELPICTRTSLLDWLEGIAVCTTNAAICRQIQRPSVGRREVGCRDTAIQSYIHQL